MRLVAKCIRCAWIVEAAADLDEIVRAAVELDAHLVTAHDVSFQSASEESKRWLAHAALSLAPGDASAK